MSGWKLAFQKAKEVEEEGAKDFQDILNVRKRKMDADEDGSDEDVEESTSGYCQSKTLSKFVAKSVKKGALTDKEIRKLTKLKEEASETEIKGDSGNIKANSESNSTGIDSRQICRTWLKNHYLSIGAPCGKPDCPRQHKITCTRPESLYGDFAFKGLQPKHKEIILKAVRDSLSGGLEG